jgi:hypothetical protein
MVPKYHNFTTTKSSLPRLKPALQMADLVVILSGPIRWRQISNALCIVGGLPVRGSRQLGPSEELCVQRQNALFRQPAGFNCLRTESCVSVEMQLNEHRWNPENRYQCLFLFTAEVETFRKWQGALTLCRMNICIHSVNALALSSAAILKCHTFAKVSNSPTTSPQSSYHRLRFC